MTGRRRLALAEAPREQRQLVQAIARVRLAPDKPCGVFEQQLRMAPAVLSAVHVTGDVDYELRCQARRSRTPARLSCAGRWLAG